MPSADLADLFLRVSRQVRRRLVAVLEPWGLSPHESRALAVVARHQPIRPGVLAERLRIAPRSATDVTDSLERAGLVHRSPDPTDRRALVIALTERGADLAEAIATARERELAAFFGGLSAADRKALVTALQALADQGPSHSRR